MMTLHVMCECRGITRLACMYMYIVQALGKTHPISVILTIDWVLVGNSKTRLVMAAASTYSLPVISLSVADVYSAYVGKESP